MDDQNAKVRQRWLDKLWLYIFDGDTGGLISPGQIHRERRDRKQLRAVELAAILEAERDVKQIHQGTKQIDHNGKLVDTPPVENIATHSIIENPLISNNQDIGLDNTADILQSAAKHIGVRDLERSINLRKLAILCEEEIWASPLDLVSAQPLEIQWVTRWRETAQDVFDSTLQALWAKILVQEVAQPGKYSIALLSAISQLTSHDLEMISIASKYLIDDFIYDASGRYFTKSSHKQLFDLLTDHNFISEVNFDADASQQLKVFSSQESSHFKLLFACHDKALSIFSDDHRQTLKLPIYKTTRVGCQILNLCGGYADLAYLFDLASYIKEQGFNVVLGDWKLNDTLEMEFIEKMVV